MKKCKILAVVTFCVYIVFLILAIAFFFDLTLSDKYRTREINLVPFVHSDTHGRSVAVRIIDDVLIFVPFGVFLRLFKRKLYLSVAIIAGAAIILELGQYATAVGCCDITDMLLYTAGGLTGCGLTSLIYRIFNKNEDKTTRMITIVSSTTLLCISAFFGFMEICYLIAHI